MNTGGSVTEGHEVSRKPNASRIALGTVQFGLGYGVANTRGQLPLDEAAAILSLARASGCDTLDTAVGYGDSEARLGSLGVGGFQVVTKLPGVPAGAGAIDQWIADTLVASLQRLRIDALHGVLLHRPHDLLGEHGPAIVRGLERAQAEGRVEKIGVSVSSPADLDAVHGRLPLQIVQAPFNVLDRRLVTSGWLDRLLASGVEVHARSIFLQGVLLMPREARPAMFDAWESLWSAWEEWLRHTGQTALRSCVAHALHQPGIARIVVGVDSLGQWAEALHAAGSPPMDAPAALATDDPLLVEPFRWNQL